MEGGRRTVTFQGGVSSFFVFSFLVSFLTGPVRRSRANVAGRNAKRAVCCVCVLRLFRAAGDRHCARPKTTVPI